MKRIILFSLTLLLAIFAKAQQNVSYAYNAAGNRTSRTIVVGTKSTSATENPVDTVFHKEDDKMVRIYPYPVETQLTIQISGYTPSMKGEYSLYNITGAMVAKQSITGGITHLNMGRHFR